MMALLYSQQVNYKSQKVVRLHAVSSILAQFHSLVEINRELFSIVADSRRVGVHYKLKYVHKLQVNPLVASR